jgi:hypothetical protein
LEARKERRVRAVWCAALFIHDPIEESAVLSVLPGASAL